MDTKLLKALTEVPAISGREDLLIADVSNKLKAYTDDVHIDRLGNVTATFAGKPGAPSIAYFAHLDELGLIVRRVEENGFLRIERMGGVPEKALLCTFVEVFTIDGSKRYPGVVGTCSHHLTRSSPLPLLQSCTSTSAPAARRRLTPWASAPAA